MKRFTYFDEDLQEYRLVEDIEPEELICALGVLEDYKEVREVCSYADYIKSIREKKNMTQAQFARLIHEERSNLANYETRACKPPKEFWYNLNYYALIDIEEIKSLYRRIEYQIDDEILFDIIETSKDQKAVNEAVGLLLKSDREFYEISKSDLARALDKYVDGIMTSNRITKFENGKNALTPWFCAKIRNVLESQFNIQSRSLKHLEACLLRRKGLIE